MTAVRAPAAPGFYGKLLACGDFVGRRLPGAFVAPWDQWLQEGISCSRTILGSAWLPAYLTSPLWRFALAPGLCGEDPAVGVVMPSVDAVGRHFPLTIAAVLQAAPAPTPFDLAARAESWFQGLEAVALSALDRRTEPDRLDKALDALGAPPSGDVAADAGPACVSALPDSRWLRCEVAAESLPTLARDIYPSLLDRLARAALGAYSVWWTAGSDDVPPSLRVYPGLPSAADFASLLSERAAAALATGETTTPAFPDNSR